MGILYQDVFGIYTEIHRNTQEGTGCAHMDLSPEFKRLLTLLYIRYLPGILWNHIISLLFTKTS